MQVVDGKFELVRLLGEGGMGAVYEARNLRSGKRVALKRMSGALGGSSQAAQRFVREAQVATAIEHPGVVEVYDVGIDGDAPYIVMEILTGEPLSALLEREGRVAPRRFVGLLGRALGALAVAHARGIVHRDLKPDNVFLARVPGTGELAPKLLDFGISKLRAERGELSLTRTGAVMGTPFYMSPEQAEGFKNVDARADIYSLGVIFFQALAGRLPFEAETLPALLHALFTKTPPHLGDVAPDVPRPVADVVMRAMARSFEDRYPDVESFVRALASALGDPSVITEAALPAVSAVAPTMDLSRTQTATPAPLDTGAHTGPLQTPAPWVGATIRTPPPVGLGSATPPPPVSFGHATPPPGPHGYATPPPGSFGHATPPPHMTAPWMGAGSYAPPTPFVTTNNVPSPPPRSRRGLLIGLLGASLGVTGALAGVLLMRGNEHTRGAETSIAHAASPAPPAAAALSNPSATPPNSPASPTAPAPAAAPLVPAPAAPAVVATSAPVAPPAAPAVAAAPAPPAIVPSPTVAPAAQPVPSAPSPPSTPVATHTTRASEVRAPVRPAYAPVHPAAPAFAPVAPTTPRTSVTTSPAYSAPPTTPSTTSTSGNTGVQHRSGGLDRWEF